MWGGRLNRQTSLNDHSKNIILGISECDGIIILQVVYVTAVMPYVILLILFIRGLFLEGATRGLFYFANPVMERLGDPEVRMPAPNMHVICENKIAPKTVE